MRTPIFFALFFGVTVNAAFLNNNYEQLEEEVQKEIAEQRQFHEEMRKKNFSDGQVIELPNLPTKFEHSLFESAHLGEMEILKKIRSQTNMIGESDSQGISPLMYAIWGQQIEAVSYLKNECPFAVRSVLSDGTNALHFAICSRNLEILRELMKPFGNSSERHIRANLALLRMFTQKCAHGNAFAVAGVDTIRGLLFELQHNLLNCLSNIAWGTLKADFDNTDSDSNDD